MKRSVILLVCALCTWMAMAQDIIVTKDAKRIEAKIQEVSSTEIKYKKFTYQDGPVFVLPIADVNSILFENGDVQVYNEQPTPAEKATPQPVQPQPVQTAVEKGDEGKTVANVMEKHGDFYMLKQGNTTTRMDKQAYLRFIQNNCPEAWQRYLQGNKLWKAGWGLLGAGIGIEMLIGVPLYCAGLVNSVNDAVYYNSYSNYNAALVVSRFLLDNFRISTPPL